MRWFRSAVLTALLGGLCVTPVPSVVARDEPVPKQVEAKKEPAGPVKIVGETKLPPYRIVRLKAENVPPKFGMRWRVKAADKANQQLIDWATGDRVQKPEWVAPPGTYTVILDVAGPGPDGEFILDGDEVVVTIGRPTPVPVDPDVVPPPDVDPDVKPTVAPIQKPGLRVAIIRESDANAQTALTAGQREVIRPGRVWDYLRTKTVTEPENPNGAFRILDPQMNPLTNGDPDGKTWAAALARPRVPTKDPFTNVTPPELPWVIISNGTRNVGFEGPIPPDITGDKFLELVRKFE